MNTYYDCHQQMSSSNSWSVMYHLYSVWSKQYFYYALWGPKEKEFLMMHYDNENEPEPSSCICLAHQREVQRKHPASSYRSGRKKSPPNIVHIVSVCVAIPIARRHQAAD